jgi:type IV pilus biogenesis protein CpaD/CtpE
MLVIHDDGKIEYMARNAVTVIAPASALTQADRDTLRPLVAKLRNAGRAQLRAALTAVIQGMVDE